MRIAATDFRDYPRDRFVDAQSGVAVRLAPTFLLTHEMGAEGDLREELTATEWARVEFHLPSAKVKGAELLFYVNADARTRTRSMRLLVNGHRLSHRQVPERMLTGGWDRCRVPTRYLKDGTNEFVFAGNGVLHVDPVPDGLADQPASCSSRSFDGGQTWHQGAHGPSRTIAGEYLVRLRVRGYAPAGRLTSPVVDLADPRGAGRIVGSLHLGAIRLIARTRLPKGTRVEFELRTGTTPDFDPRTWTPWTRGTRLAQAHRFVQWRAGLSTKSADATPVLEAVVLDARIEEERAPVRTLRFAEFDHPEVVRGSYEFAYLGPCPRQERLRQEWQLDEVVAKGRTELEQLALLRDWVHSQWLGWQSGKYPYCPPWDPLEILEVTKGNWGFGMCTHYGATMAGCAAALGFVSRVVVIDHHCLAEIWSDELQKWILEDAGPAREFDATYEVDGVPLSALELHELLRRGKQGRIQANKLPQAAVEPMTAYAESFVRFGIPLRNTHLETAEPAELRHGNGQYHWDGYLWWSDDLDPKYPEYSLQSSRPADFYWSVNQTRLYLSAADRDGALRVDLGHTAPNLSHFLVQRDDGGWLEQREAALEWDLHPGENSLAVRTVNLFGRAGRISRARVRRAR
ncbi:MAG: hypothetical protein WDA75_04905 [Candidatus Latescibacterota bacterium]|jgi:hypothetical protein